MYNCQRYLIETLDGVKRQTHRNYEVLLIDDGSTDQTYRLAADYCAADSRFKLYQNSQNMGVANTRNRGFELASGDYIALLDSDDIWLEDKLARQLQHMCDNALDISYTSYRFMTNQSALLDDIYHTKVGPVSYGDLLKENFIGCSTVMLKRQLVASYKMNPRAYHEDYYWWLTLIKAGYVFGGLDEVLTYYRLADSGRSSNKFNALVKRYQILRQLEGLGPFKTLYYLTIYGLNGFKKHWRFMIK